MTILTSAVIAASLPARPDGEVQQGEFPGFNRKAFPWRMDKPQNIPQLPADQAPASVGRCRRAILLTAACSVSVPRLITFRGHNP